MRPGRIILATAGGALLLGGCARYQPQPLAPASSLAAFEQRALDPPAVRAALDRLEPQRSNDWPRRRWSLNELTVAALELSPELAVARTDLLVAEAGIRTASARPNPTLSLVPEYAVPPGPGPWIVGALLDVPVETAGKRTKRVAVAGQATMAARWAWADSAWQVRSRVRAALVEHLSARREAELVAREAGLRSELLRLTERKREAGETSTLEVAAVLADQLASVLAERTAETRVVTTRTALARALGVPVAALADLEFDWPGFDSLPGAGALTRESVQTASLLNRADVQRSLAEYAAAEATLRLEVARQYPDIHLNPGYQWDQRVSKYAFGLSVVLPILDQNQGPIGEAAARRSAAEARFLALQARVIGETEAAVAGFRGASAGWSAADEVSREAQRLREFLQRAVDLGEADRLALAAAEVQSLVFARSRLAAGRDAQQALGALEDALQRPIAGEIEPRSVWQTTAATGR